MKKWVLSSLCAITGFGVLASPVKKTNGDGQKEPRFETFHISQLSRFGASTLGEETKIEEPPYEFPDDSTALLKQSRDEVGVWSATPIANQEEFRTNYLASDGRDPSIKDDSNFHFMSGYGTFDLGASTGNPTLGVYTFTHDDSTGKVTMTCDDSKISHVVYFGGSTPTPTVPVNTPTPTVPVNTPTPTVPGQTPTPTVPGQTPTPTVPGSTPTPPVDFPKTGDNETKVTLAVLCGASILGAIIAGTAIDNRAYAGPNIRGKRKIKKR